MAWQDIVFSIGSWVFVFALLPSVFSKDKPAFSSSITTATVLTVFVFTYASLGLWLTAVSAGLLTLTWCVLAIQKFLMNQKVKKVMPQA
ncbi:MAG TPA: hypothetical protein VFE94_00300 [Candidatus Paceibacterota bacterium]|nr:hypothetical protein [Candidatus Paceibacterota bacterium]